jgi:hypothetical protein
MHASVSDGDVSGAPTAGLSPSDREGFRVIWTEDDVEPRALPEGNERFACGRVALCVDTSVPGIGDPSLPEIEEAEDEFDEFHDVRNEFSDPGGHQLLGRADFIQSSVEEDTVHVVHGCASDWRLLLQIDTDEALDMMWGDAATGATGPPTQRCAVAFDGDAARPADEATLVRSSSESDRAEAAAARRSGSTVTGADGTSWSIHAAKYPCGRLRTRMSRSAITNVHSRFPACAPARSCITAAAPMTGCPANGSSSSAVKIVSNCRSSRVMARSSRAGESTPPLTTMRPLPAYGVSVKTST